jgi:hypothetical protein
MQFGDVELQLPPDPTLVADVADDDKMPGFLQEPFSLLKGSLIAATPLLSGVLQSLFGLIFKH